MRNTKRIVAVLLAALTVLSSGFRCEVHAEVPCGHRGYPTKLDYRRKSNKEGDIDTYGLCGTCGEWYLYCAAENHMWEMTDVAYPTCTTDGYYVIECKNCGAKEKTITDKAFGHQWGSWNTVKEPTCTEDGQRVRICEECDTEQKEKIAAAGHKWGKWKETRKATCAEDGEETRECSVCGEKETRKIDKKDVPHTWDQWKTDKEPTCTEEGLKKRVCKVCGEEETEKIEPAGHEWGEWTLTRPAGHGQEGEETRECSVCKEQETRPVEGEDAIAAEGDSGLEVLVTQQLLADGGEYKGEVDGVFTAELAAAIRTYEAAAGFPETGAIYPDTLQSLTARYLDFFEGDLPHDGVLHIFGSGLKTLLLYEDHCVSNGNGTHENTPVGIGVRYILGEAELPVTLPQEKRVTFPTVTEPCSVQNEKLTCAKCGWKQEWETAFAKETAFELAFGGGTVRINLPTGLGLPEIENIIYIEDMKMLSWDAFAGAASYEADLFLGETETPTENKTDEPFLSMDSFATGNYTGTVQAYGADGQPVSEPGAVAFFHQGDTMPPPEMVRLAYGTAQWDYPYGMEEPVFLVDLLIGKPGEEMKSIRQEETGNKELDITDILIEEGPFPQGTGIQVMVTARDPEGVFKDSAGASSDPQTLFMPDWYKATAAVNVRSGPGRDYDRIGGLSKGDFVPCWGLESGEDGTYAIISYQGQTGYVLFSCLVWIARKDFTVLTDLSDGRTVNVRANMDGTLNEVDFLRQVQKSGYLVDRILVDGNKEFEWDYELTSDSRLLVTWKPDPEYVFVTFHSAFGTDRLFADPDIPGKMSNILPIRIGSVCPKPKVFETTYNEAKTFWTTDSAGEASVVNAQTRFTADMTEVYQHFLRPEKEQEIIIGADTLFVTDIYKCIFSDDKLNQYTTVLGVLEPGDRIRIRGIVRQGNEVSRKYYTYNGETYCVIPDFYIVYCERLGSEGYLLCRTLDRMQTDSLTVHFDANGGWCPVKSMTARPYVGYAYRTLLEMPPACKDGYMFAGWADENGTVYTAGSEFQKETFLKAKWTVGIEYPKKIGVTVPAHIKADGEAFFYRKSPDAKETFRMKPGKEVTVIGENDRMYECLWRGETIWLYKDNVCTDFERRIYRDPQGSGWHAPVHNPPNKSESIGGIRNGGVYYVVGSSRKGSWYRVYPIVFDAETVPMWINEDVPRSAEKMSRGYGWTGGDYHNYYGYREEKILLDPGRGYCDLEYVTAGAGGDGPGLINYLPKASCPGFEFEGWFTDPLCGERIVVGSEVIGSKTLYAHYKGVYEGYCVATQEAPIYDRTSTSKGKILGYVSPGETIAVDDESKTGKFYYTSCHGVSGWVQSRYLALADQKQVLTNFKKDRYVRKGPKMKAKSIRKIVYREVFMTVDGENGYAKVAYPGQGDGFAWVAKDQLEDF